MNKNSKPFKPMKDPRPSDSWGCAGKWTIVADDGRNPPTYLHDDLEWYDDGCWSRRRTKGDVVVYDTTAQFDSESLAWERRALYYLKHDMLHLIREEKLANVLETTKSEVMEF